MRYGFTLIELVIVMALIATLTGIVFPLMKIGEDQIARNRTHDRVNRLANCLSSYKAVFGHYPAVPLHGSRDYHLVVDNYGIQSDRSTPQIEWRNVRAALLSQPVTVEYPFDPRDVDAKGDVTASSKADASWAKAVGDKGEATAKTVLKSGYKQFDVAKVSSKKKETSWRKLQMFRFGLLSFLLPRAFVMMNASPTVYDDYACWTSENDLASYYDFATGRNLFQSWSEMSRTIREGGSECAIVSNCISQAACAKWIANLEGIVNGGKMFYGVDTGSGEGFRERENELRDSLECDLLIHSTGTASSQYVLDGMTVVDGWGGELFYYSPYPYSQCRVWSAGEDRKSFAPWVDLRLAEGDSEIARAMEWTKDDIVALPR